MIYLEDHGLPLVKMKERRRELVMALRITATWTSEQIAAIAALQQAIIAVEEVIADLDAEVVAAISSQSGATSAGRP